MLAMLVSKFHEVECVFVFDRELRLVSNVLWNRHVKVRLIQQRLLVSVVLNLVDQDALGPAELLRPLHVELALGWLLATLQDDQILGPANFSHKGCEFFVLGLGFAELLDSPQVSGGEAADTGKFRADIFGKILNYGAPPSLALLALADEPSDVPVKGQQFRIDSA